MPFTAPRVVDTPYCSSAGERDWPEVGIHAEPRKLTLNRKAKLMVDSTVQVLRNRLQADTDLNYIFKTVSFSLLNLNKLYTVCFS